MAYDGSLKFDTKVNTDGFESGISSLKDVMERLTSAVEKLTESIMDSFQNAGNAAESIGSKAEKSAAGVEEIGDAARRAQKDVADLEKQMEAITVTRHDDEPAPELPPEEMRTAPLNGEFQQYGAEVQQFVDQYAAGMNETGQHTNEFRQEIEMLTAQLNALEQQGLYFGDEEYDEAFMRLSASKQALAEYKRELTKPLPPPDTDRAGQHTNEFRQEIESLSAQLREMEQQGLYFGDDNYDETYMKLAKVKQALADYKKEMLSPAPDAEIPVKLDMNSFEGQKQQLKQQLADLEKQGITLGSPDYDAAYVALQRVIQAEREYKKSLMETDEAQNKASGSAGDLKRSLDDVSRSSKKADKAAVPLTKSILKLGNMFKLMLLRMAMRAVIDGVKEGMQNLAQYSDEMNASMSGLQSSLLYLKNGFATAFAPILSYIVPALNALIDAIAAALAWIAQLFAALSGKGTYVKAKKTQEDYAASLKKTGGAAKAAGKEAERSTASFDKLNVISEQGSGSGGGGGATDPSDMFETVEVSSELVSILDVLKNKWSEVASLFSKGFSFGLGDTTSRIKTITDGLQSIKRNMKEIFTDPGVQKAARNWAETVVYNLGVAAGSVASIGLTIAANLIGGMAIYLEEAKDRIKQYLISMFDISAGTSTIVANFMAAFANIFSALAGENGQQLTANLIGLFTEAFMGVSELAAKWGRDILDALLTPITNNQERFKSAFNGLLGIAAQVMGDLKKIMTDSFQKMNQTYDAHVKPMFDSFRDGLTEIYGVALEAFETHILPSMQKVADKFSEFREKHLQPLIDRFIEFGGKVADTVKIIWENALKPFLIWATQTFAPLLGTAIEGVGTFFNGLFETVAEVMGNILDALEGVLTFIQGVFTGDMDLALNGIKNIFKGVFNGIITIVERAVNAIVKGLNGVSFDVPDWVPGIGGNHFGFSLRTVDLPRLATGTVVPPRAGEFAAILGDNNRETEVVSPLSTIKQALIEALGAFGGMGSGDTYLTVELDGETVYQNVIRRNQATKNRTGVNPLLE